MQLSRRSIAAVAVLLAVTMITASSALAALLPPGGSVVPTVTGSPTGATQLATTGAVNFTSLVDPAAYSGTLTTRVFNNDAGNPFGLNRLTFVFQLANNATSRDAIERFVANNYTGFQVDAAQNPAGGGRAPSTADRQPTGVSVGFDYTNTLPISPGTSSTLLVLHTDATQFVPVTNTIANTFPALVASFGPVVPEPASISAIAVAGLALVARRRSR
jgi:hypothetical protein